MTAAFHACSPALGCPSLPPGLTLPCRAQCPAVAQSRPPRPPWSWACAPHTLMSPGVRHHLSARFPPTQVLAHALPSSPAGAQAICFFLWTKFRSQFFFFDHQLSPEKNPNALFGVPLEFEDLTGPPATLLPPRRSFAAPAPPLGPSLVACQPRGGRGPEPPRPVAASTARCDERWRPGGP